MTDTINVALVVPRSGSAGIYGPSCEACAEMAIADLNAAAGLLGRPVRLIPIDGSRAPDIVAADVGRLVAVGAIDAVSGWHISPVRQAIARVTANRVPYVYGPLYEGGERTPGLFLTGETPSRQLLPAMDWMKSEYGIDRWVLIGNDYIWPRQTGLAASQHAVARGQPLLDEIYVPLGTADFSSAIRRVEATDAAGVVMLLVGADGVAFNRQFAASGLADAVPRLSPHVEENMLMASGCESNCRTVRRRRILRGAEHDRQHGFCRTLLRALRLNGTCAQQHRRILLRGDHAADRVGLQGGVT